MNTQNYLFSIILGVLALFVNPILWVLVATIVQLYTPFSKLIVLPLFVISFANFYSSRKIGIPLPNGGDGDDVTRYLDYFHNMELETVRSLINQFIEMPSGNEFLFHFLLFIARQLTENQDTFLFAFYFTAGTLLAIASILIDRKYFILPIAIIFFGIGGFLDQSIIHIWRSTIAALVALIGLKLYIYKPKLGIMIFLSSIFIHLALIIFFLIFVFTIIFLRKVDKLLLIISGIAIALVGILFFSQFSNQIYYDLQREIYLNDAFKIFLITTIFLYLKKNTFVDEKLVVVMGVAISFIYIFFPAWSFVASRLYLIEQIILCILIYGIIKPIIYSRRYVVVILIIALFSYKLYSLNNSYLIKDLFGQQYFKIFNVY